MMMQYDASSYVHEQRTAVYVLLVTFRTRTGTCGVPSSTLIRTFESGLRAIAAMFFRFSKGNVYDLLLCMINTVRGHVGLEGTLLDEVERRNTVPDGAEDGVAVRGEYNVSLSVYSTTEVGELPSHMVFSNIRGFLPQSGVPCNSPSYCSGAATATIQALIGSCFVSCLPQKIRKRVKGQRSRPGTTSNNCSGKSLAQNCDARG
jgi:hypothetical protein